MTSLLTIKELSETLKVSERKIYQMVHEEFIPSVKIGHCLRFKEKDIEVWLSKLSRRGRTRRVPEIEI